MMFDSTVQLSLLMHGYLWAYFQGATIQSGYTHSLAKYCSNKLPLSSRCSVNIVILHDVLFGTPSLLHVTFGHLMPLFL